MTNPTTSDLIERLEKAEEGSRELDGEIAAALRLGVNLPDWAARWEGEWRPTIQGSVVLMQADGKSGPHFSSLSYTTSLDAAMSLVPEGWRWVELAHPRKDEPCRMALVSWTKAATGSAATPALALCIAALRARETTNGG